MNDAMTVEERIVSKFVEKLESDQSIPREVADRIRSLWEKGSLNDVDAIVTAITEGVKDHAKNSTA